MINPFVTLGLVIAWGSSIAGAFFYGQGIGVDSEIAKQAGIDEVVRKTRESAQLGAADAIAKIKITNTTVRGKTETIVRENVRYVECTHADGMRELINEAIAGSKSTGSSSVPRANITKR